VTGIHAAARGPEHERERLRAVIEALPDALVILDGAGTVTDTNAAARLLFAPDTAGAIPGAAHADLRLRSLGDERFPPSARPAARALRGERVTGVEMVYPRPDGTRVVLLAAAVPLLEDGQVAGVLAVYQDITSLKEREQAQHEFLATASHDLRNPLTTARGLVQLLRRRLERDTTEPQKLRESLGTVERQLDRFGEMLATLLDVSRIQMGRLEIEREPVNLAALIAELVEQRQAVTPTHQLRFSLAGPHGDLPPDQTVVLAERTRILQVMDNLLGNAIKYSPNGGSINVRVTADASGVTVAVQDEGIGVPAAALPHLFDRFYRTEGARGRQLEGTGLGLYITRGIVEALGGRTGVFSTGEGRGTRVWFTLPPAPP